MRDKTNWEENTLINNIDILCLEKALKIYVNSDIVIMTHPSKWKEIQEYLVEVHKIDKIKIINLELFDKFISCSKLRYDLRIQDDSLSFCCAESLLQGKLPKVSLDLEDPEKCINSLLNFRDSLISKIKLNIEEEYCIGCPSLIEDYWIRPANSSRRLDCSMTAPCQYNCCYCSMHKQLSGFKNIRKFSFSQFEPLLETLRQRKIINKNTKIVWVAGELSILQQNKIISFFELEKLDYIASNAYIYSAEISEVLKNNHGVLSVSLDAGTPQTYRKVKGVDYWEQVIMSLKNYKSDSIRISLKYILLEDLNDTYEDISRFIYLAKSLEVEKVVLTRDVTKEIKLTPERMQLIELFKELSIKLGISYVIYAHLNNSIESQNII